MDGRDRKGEWSSVRLAVLREIMDRSFARFLEAF
jgi:hypothetical protein